MGRFNCTFVQIYKYIICTCNSVRCSAITDFSLEFTSSYASIFHSIVNFLMKINMAFRAFEILAIDVIEN